MLRQVLILSIIAVAISGECKYKYQCSDNMVEKQCVGSIGNITDATFYLHECTETNAACPKAYTGGSNSTCVVIDPKNKPKPTYLVDTEDCGGNGECASGACTSGACVGKANDETCKTTLECKVGSSCQGGKCKAQIAAGGSGCKADMDCQNNEFCANEKCIAPQSLDDGAIGTASTCKSGKVIMVVNGTSFNNYCASTKLTSGSSECNSTQTTCDYSVSGVKDKNTTTEACVCSTTMTPKSLCPPATDNENWTAKLALLKKAYDGADTSKHAARGRVAGYVGTSVTEKKQMYFPKFEGADDCVVNFISASKIAVGFLTFLALLF